MQLLFILLRKRFMLFAISITASVLTAAVTLWWNIQLAVIINNVITGSFPPIHIIVSLLIIVPAMSISAYFKTWISGFFCETLTHDLRTGYAKHFISLPVSEIENINTGQELSKLQNEIADVSAYLNTNFFQLIDDCIRFIVTVIWLIMINYTLFLIINVPAVIIIGYIIYSGKIIAKATKHSQLAKGRMNKYAESLLVLFPLIKLYNSENLMLVNYEKETDDWELQTVKSEYTQARLMSLSGVLSKIPLMLLFLSGGAMVINGTFVFGTFYAFFNLFVVNVSGVMMNMPGYIASFKQFLVNMKLIKPKILLASNTLTEMNNAS